MKLEEGVFKTNMTAISVHLTKDSMNAIATSRKELYPVRSFHNIDFRMLVAKQGFELGEAVPALVNFMPNLQLNITCVGDDEISNHKIVTSADWNAMSKLCRDMLGIGPHVHIFTSALQFRL